MKPDTASRRVLMVGVTAALLAGLAGIPYAIDGIKALWAEASFRSETVDLAWEADRRLRAITTPDAHEQYFTWYVESMRSIVRRHLEQGPATQLREMQALNTIYGDLQAWLHEAATMRAMRVSLQVIPLSRYSNDETYAASRAKCETLIGYLTGRPRLYQSALQGHRKLIAQIGLASDESARLSQALEQFDALIEKEADIGAQRAESYRRFMQLIDFLHEHKTDFVTGDNETIRFKSRALSDRFQVLADTLKPEV